MPLGRAGFSSVRLHTLSLKPAVVRALGISGGAVPSAGRRFTVTRHNPDTVTATGPGTSGTNGEDLATTVSQAGDYTVTEDARCQDNTDNQSTFDFTVKDALGGSIDVTPDPAVVNQPAGLNVVPTGGNPGYTYSWDLNNDGTLGDDVTHNPTTTFTTTGPHVVSVKLTDNSSHSFQQTHTTTITRTITVPMLKSR